MHQMRISTNVFSDAQVEKVGNPKNVKLKEPSDVSLALIGGSL
jgi:hypothetical protein